MSNYYAQAISLLREGVNDHEIVTKLAAKHPKLFIELVDSKPSLDRIIYTMFLAEFGEYTPALGVQKKIWMLKKIREITGLGLGEAKEISEDYLAEWNLGTRPNTYTSSRLDRAVSKLRNSP